VTGRHIRDAVLSVARGGAGTQDYITIKLTDVIVTSVALGAAVEFKFDLKKNRPL
jgi:type VI protein secretion system component Hcp